MKMDVPSFQKMLLVNLYVYICGCYSAARWGGGITSYLVDLLRGPSFLRDLFFLADFRERLSGSSGGSANAVAAVVKGLNADFDSAHTEESAG